MEVEKYAPFTSSPLDASRGRGRRFILPRLRPTTMNSVRRSASMNESTPTVVVFLSQPTDVSLTAQQQTIPQLGGSSNGKNTK
jgi:hypothetical protein